MGSQPFREKRVGRAIALESPVRQSQSGVPSALTSSWVFPNAQCLGLSKQVRHKQIVMITQWLQGLAEADEIARDELRSLMYELIERVLAVRPRFAPDDRPESDIQRTRRPV